MARKVISDKRIYRGKYNFNNKEWKEIIEASKELSVTPNKFIKWCIEKELRRRKGKENVL